MRITGISKSEYNFKNKVIVITGASSGIGKACAFEFAGQGAKVVLAARNIAELEIIEDIINKQGGDAYNRKSVV